MSSDDLVLDLTNYKDTTGSYVTPGRYPVVVEDAELGKSSNKGTPQLTLWLRVVGGDFDGSSLVDQLYLTEKSLFRTVGFLQALGIKTPRGKLTFKLQTFLNRRLFVVVEDDTYNGKTRSRVSAFEKLVTAEGASSEDFDEFAALDSTSAAVDDLPTEVAAPAETPATAEPKVSAPSEIGNRAASEIGTPAPSAPHVEEEEEGAIDLDDLNLD